MNSFTVTKLDGDNFDTWLNQVNNICRAQGCAYVLEHEIDDGEKIEAGSKLDQHYGLAMYLINQSLNIDDERYVNNCKSLKTIGAIG